MCPVGSFPLFVSVFVYGDTVDSRGHKFTFTKINYGHKTECICLSNWLQRSIEFQVLGPLTFFYFFCLFNKNEGIHINYAQTN